MPKPSGKIEPGREDALMPEPNRGGRDLIIAAPATFVDHLRPDGVVVRWESRHHRKHQKSATGSTWWAPRARGWWIAILFGIGSLLFALGSVPGYASAVGDLWDTVTYFAGSVFFTSASFLSYREAVDAAPTAQNPAHRRFFVYQPGRICQNAQSRSAVKSWRPSAMARDLRGSRPLAAPNAAGV